MGAKRSCYSPNGGGVSLLYALHIANVVHSLHFQSPPALHEGKKWQKLDFIWYALVFSRDFGRQQTAKPNIFLKSRKGNRCGGGRLAAFWRAHWWQVVQGAWASGGLSWRVPSLCPSLLSAFLLCSCMIALEYAFICDFKAVFRGF